MYPPISKRVLTFLGPFYNRARRPGARPEKLKKKITPVHLLRDKTPRQINWRPQERERTMMVDWSGVLTALFAVAGLATAGANRIRSERTARSQLPFSDAVWHGDTLYLSGHIGLEPKTGKPGATPEEEARLVMDGIKGTLASAGLTMDDLLSVQIFCSDVSLFERFNAVYVTYFKGEFPARAFLGSGRLLFDARFEVQAIAGRQRG
jgi:2-iminobutanoate/2-iminopropanoate deaminase